MSRVRAFLARTLGLVRSSRFDQDIRDQIDAHLEESTEEFLRQGLSPEEARRAARLTFGSVAHAEEACRDARGRWHHDLSKDLGYGWRMLQREPTFAAVAILSLAVGIGANSAIFSIVNSALLRPRPVANPDQLVELYTGTRNEPYDTGSYPSYVDFRERNDVFTGLAAYSMWQFRMGDPNEVEYVWGEVVSGNYFDVLGVRPHHGRTFIAGDDVTPGSHPVAVIGHALWVRRFNADPDLIGRPVTINGQKLTVIGIAPPRYTGMMGGLASEVFVPIMTLPLLEPARGAARLSRSSRWLMLVGRLEPDTTIEQAKARFDVLSREMQAAHPEEWRSTSDSGVRELFVSVLAERDTRIHPAAQIGTYATVGLVVVIVNLVMLIACMNLAGMLLARSVVRRKEIAVRLALGAGRFRIIRQLLTESVLLSLIAGTVGMVAGAWLLDLLLASMPALPEGVRPALDVRLDWRVLAYTIGVAMVTGAMFGLAPALQGSRTNVSAVLKEEASAFAGGYRQSRVRAGLIVAQVAFSLLLLFAAGLVLRSLENVRPTRLGFSSDKVVVASVSLDDTRFDRSRSQAAYRQLSERLSSMPGVEAVTLAQGMPGGFMTRTRRGTEIEGYQPAPGETLQIDASFVGPHYFTNMKIPIVQGRDFDARDRDGAPCVAIVNEAFSRRYFSTAGSPLGKRLTKFESERPPEKCEIVAVVRDDRWQSLQKDVRPFYWMPSQQAHRARMTLLVHTAGDPAGQIAGVRRALQALDPNMPVGDIRTLRDYFGMTTYPFRLLGLLLGACGVMVLLLATIGIFGLVSYSVAQRTREVGIRIALGALPREILTMVVGPGMTLVAWGLVLGLLLSVALARILSSSLFDTERLFGVSVTDSLTFAAVTILLAVVALLACIVPALRATRIDPMKALRYE